MALSIHRLHETHERRRVPLRGPLILLEGHHMFRVMVRRLFGIALVCVASLKMLPSPASAQVRPALRPTSLPATQIALRFENVSVTSVLEQLSRDYGFEIPINEAPASVRVDVISLQPVSPDEAVRILNAALRPKGYTAITNGRLLKVVARDKAKKGAIPVYVGSDPTAIADTDDLITQVIPVTGLDAVKLRQDLTPLIGTEADVTSNAASNSIVITDVSCNIKRVVKIIADLDQRQAGSSEIKVVRLKNADAEAAAKLVMAIFRPDQSQSSNSSPFPFPVLGGRGGRAVGGPMLIGPPGMGGFSDGRPQSASSADENAQGKINAAADSRTNTVVVSGPPETVRVVVGMLNELDSNPGSEQTFFMYRLKNADASNLQGVLNALFGNGSSAGSSSSQRKSVGSSRSSSSSGLSSGFGSNSRGGGMGGGNSFGGPSLGGTGIANAGAYPGGGFGVGAPGGATSSSGSRMAQELAGQVIVVADTDTNSLLVTTATKYEQRVRDIIKELDGPVPQVLIKVLIAEVTHDNNADFGTDFSILNTRPNGHGQSFGQTFGLPSQGLVINFLESNLNATLHLLAQQNKLDVLSRPYILASDNQEAYVMVGQEVPIVTSNYTTSLGQTVSNYQYQDVGIILDVIPHINPDRVVTLQVAPQISQLTAQTVTVGPGVNVPVIASRQATSQVAIKDGQTIVIGGLMQDQKTLTVNKIPILGDIPIVKYAFSRTIVDKTKTELLIFLTPHVAPNPEVLSPMSADELKGTRLTPSAVQPGTFDEHIRGLERGSTTRP